ncbi:MAG: DUF262 domain-containing protein [Proteobacteria bacterium]|nr:DUF262 domain-containing protein [Pseudomonadota bacterium]
MVQAVGGVEKLGSFMTASSFSVPAFQRNYAWETPQIDAFWSDVVFAFEHDRDHFLGSLIVLQDNLNGTSQVIDGQQRLTTIFILIAILRDQVFEIPDRVLQPQPGVGGMAFDVGHDIVSTLFRNLPEGLARFEANEHIKKTFFDCVVRNPGDPERKAVKSKGDETSAKLRKSYLRLAKFVSEYFSVEGQSDQARLKRLYDFYRAMVDRLQVLKVVCSSTQEAIEVYMTLNSRGLGLQQSDLVKSLLIMNAVNPKQAADDWSELVDDVGEGQIDQFLRYYLIAYGPSNESVRVKEVFSRFEQWLNDGDRNDVAARTAFRLADLQKKGKTFAQLIGNDDLPAEHQALALTFAGLDTVLDSYRVLLFVVLDSAVPLQTAQRHTLVKAVECLVLRWLVAGGNAQELETLFQAWARLLRNAAPAAFDQLLQEIKSHQKGDEVVRVNLRQPLDSIPLARFMLFRLNEVLTGENQMVEFEPKKAHVEHIAPKKPTPYWYEALSCVDEAGNPIQSDYDELKELVGNKTILDHLINKKIQNLEWSVKKAGKLREDGTVEMHGYHHSTFSGTTRDLESIDYWSKECILRRTEWFIDSFLKIWSVDQQQQGVVPFSVWPH